MSSEKPLTLLLPDWQHVDTVRRSPLPFVLWQVGDQPLLFHWFDYAVDEGHDSVTLICGDRPAEVRKAMESVHLWPIEWHVEPVLKSETIEAAITLDHLPDSQRGRPKRPKDGWELLDLWFELRSEWFELMSDKQAEGLRMIAVGRFCSIHPTAQLHMPVWVEDYVQIGPGCVIGPNVNLGKGAMLEGPSEVANAVITESTYLAGQTELRDAVLDGGLLLNLRHRARINGIDALIATSLRRVHTGPKLFERAYAIFLWILFTLVAPFVRRPSEDRRTLETFDGLNLTESSGALWQRRRSWLPKVISGKLRLFGVLPRSRDHLQALSHDWREILSRAPRGVFAYSDLHGSHTPDDDLEAVHAVYQATCPESEMRSVFRDNRWRLFRLKPGK